MFMSFFNRNIKSRSAIIFRIILFVYLVPHLLSCGFILGIYDGDYNDFRFWSNSRVIEADSGYPEDIRLALESTEPGDTIRIPPGIFDFEESIDLDAGVSIIGYGPELTILQNNGSLEQPFFRVDGSNGLPVRFAHMKLVGDQEAGSDHMDDGIELINGCRDFRITDIEFLSFGQAAVNVAGNSRGVIDNCRFINIYRPAIANFGYGVSVYGDGDAGWERPFILGDRNTVFVEDCYFYQNRHAVASNNGSRYVFRHNIVENNGGEDAWVQAVDAHGPGYGSSRGSRSYEIYNNSIENDEDHICWTGMYIRGGDGVIFENEIISGNTYPIVLTNDSGGPPYPALDQIRELYVWNNTFEGSPAVPVDWAEVVEEGRDYFNYERPGYKPYIYPHPLRQY